MRMILPVLIGIATAATAQSSIENGVIRSNGVTIDSRGIHTPTAEVSERGVLASTGAGAYGRNTRSIVANGQHRTVDCGGGSLAVAGNTNVLTIANCSRIDIAGNNNALTVRFAGNGSVAMPGNHNSLHWRAPAIAKIGISDPGTGNHVIRE